MKQELKSYDLNKEPFSKTALEDSRLIVTYFMKGVYRDKTGDQAAVSTL